MLIREETKSDQIHSGDGPRKNSSSAGQGRGQRARSAIKSNIPDHSMEDDEC